MKTKSQTLHFRVCPDGITRLIRDMWAEGSYSKAMSVLGSMSAGEPIPLEKQYDILRGKLKFSLFNGDPDSFCIVADNWKPRDGDYYPDPEPSKLAAYLQMRADEKSDREIKRALRGMVSLDEVEEIEPEIPSPSPKFPEMKKFAGYDSVEEMNLAFAFQRSIPTPEEVLAAHRSRDEREGKKPKADKTLTADMAWVTPDGKFYPCLTKMEHIWLAGQFGLSESQAEAAGWIKITKDFTGKRFIHHSRNSKLTQKQINTVFDWCEKHKAELPEWAGGKSEFFS